MTRLAKDSAADALPSVSKLRDGDDLFVFFTHQSLASLDGVRTNRLAVGHYRPTNAPATERRLGFDDVRVCISRVKITLFDPQALHVAGKDRRFAQ